LKLKYVSLLSNFAFNFNMRRYIKDPEAKAASEAARREKLDSSNDEQATAAAAAAAVAAAEEAEEGEEGEEDLKPLRDGDELSIDGRERNSKVVVLVGRGLHSFTLKLNLSNSRTHS
jgi:hypothetical protein